MKVEPLPKSVAELLEAERVREPLPTAEVDSAWQRLSGSLGVPGGEAAPDAPVPEPGPAGGSAETLGADVASGSWAAMFGLKTTIASLFVGGLLGFGTARWLEPEPSEPLQATPVEVAAPAAEPSPGQTVRVDDLPAPAVPTADPVPTDTAGVDTSPPGSLSASPSASAKASPLKLERLLLERARAALVRENPKEALAALDEHQAKFPDGQLFDERDSLRKQALAMEAALAAP